jgi:hypothetical protein
MMRERTALQIWILVALLAACSLTLLTLRWNASGWSLWMTRCLAGSVTLVGVLRILVLARLIYRAGRVRMAGLWILFALVTAAISTLWLLEPLFR